MLGNGTQSQTLLLKESSVRHVHPNRTPIVLRVPALSSAALFCLSTVFSIALVARIESDKYIQLSMYKSESRFKCMRTLADATA